MWPFNRNNKSTNSLKEKVSPTAVKDYYQAAGSRKGWVVWLLSIAAFLITLIIVLSLFWVGRFAWQKIRGTDDNKSTPASQGQNAPSDEQEAQKQNENNGDSAPSSPAPQPAPAPQPTPTPTPAPTPVTGDSQTGTLPNTGPSSDE